VGGEGIGRTPGGVAVGEVELAVELVAAALGDGVDDATSGTTVLSGVVGGVDLELLNGGLGGGVTGAGASTLFGEVRKLRRPKPLVSLTTAGVSSA
jgi:hypothetical protein